MWAKWGGSLFGTNRGNPPDVAHIYRHTYLSGPNRGCLYQCNIDLTPHRENSWSLFGLHIGSFSSTVYPSRDIESVLFTLFSPYLRYYQPIFPTTQSLGWYYRRSGRSMYPSCLKMSSGAGGPSDIPETPGTYSSTFAVPPLRLCRSGEIPLVQL